MDRKIEACQRFLADFKALRFPVTICVDGQKRLDFMRDNAPDLYEQAMAHINNLNMGRAFLDREQKKTPGHF